MTARVCVNLLEGKKARNWSSDHYPQDHHWSKKNVAGAFWLMFIPDGSRPTARLVFLPAFAIATSLAKVQAAHPALLKTHINYGIIMGIEWGWMHLFLPSPIHIKHPSCVVPNMCRSRKKPFLWECLTLYRGNGWFSQKLHICISGIRGRNAHLIRCFPPVFGFFVANNDITWLILGCWAQIHVGSVRNRCASAPWRWLCTMPGTSQGAMRPGVAA